MGFVNRKGEIYVRIRELNKPTRYFLYKEGTKVDAYVQYYYDKYGKQKERRTKKGSLPQYKKAYSGIKTKRKQLDTQAKKYLLKISKRPTIQKAISKGLTAADTKDALTAREAEIRKANHKMFAPLVADNTLLNLICEEENLKKIRYRFEHKISFTNEKNQVLGDTSIMGLTLKEVIQKLQGIINAGEEIKKDTSQGIAQKLKQNGFNPFKYAKDGKIRQIKIISIFRKGK